LSAIYVEESFTKAPEDVEIGRSFSTTDPGVRVTLLVTLFIKTREVVPDGKEYESVEYVKGKSVFTSARLVATPEMVTFVLLKFV